MNVSRPSFGRIIEPIYFFHFVINGFHFFGFFFFEKKKQLLINFGFFLFCLLASWFHKERSHNKLSVFEEGAIEHILRAKVWLYGIKSFFWQNLTDFCLLSICCSYCNRIKVKYRQILIFIFRNSGNCNSMGYFS